MIVGEVLTLSAHLHRIIHLQQTRVLQHSERSQCIQQTRFLQHSQRSQCIQPTSFLQHPQCSQPPRCSRYPYGLQYSQRHHSFHHYLRLTGGIVTVQR